ncbi:MAG: hypothetical protein AAGF11_13995, partial [Myxococcota bacterium]
MEPTKTAEDRATPPKGQQHLARRLSRHWRTLCSTIVTATLAVPFAAPAAPANGDFEQLLATADRHAVASDHAKAVDSYHRAYFAMPVELRTTDVGELVVLAASRHAIEANKKSVDIRTLQLCQTLVSEFITELSASKARHKPSPDPAIAMLEALEEIAPAPAHAANTAMPAEIVPQDARDTRRTSAADLDEPATKGFG